MLTTIALAAQVLSLVATGTSLVPELVAAAASVRDLLMSNRDPTDAEEVVIRAALDASEDAVQKA